ncbi:MAG TPA: hypothetical protein VFT65_04685 [Candidatus Angelobacter sp.]|nr:hypothetical protein [Candidatus Angelobacter sp.]
MDDPRLGPELHPGDICAHDGLYQVVHQSHREPHKVIISRGDGLPPCRQCGTAVRFYLVTKSAHQPRKLRAKAARRRGGG